MPYVRYDPDNPYDRPLAYVRTIFAYVLLVGFVGGNIYYIYSFVAVLSGYYSNNIWYSLCVLLLVGILGFFVLFPKNSFCKTRFFLKYAILYFGGLFDLSGIVSFIYSIYLISNSSNGFGMLVVSVVSELITTAIVILLMRKMNGVRFHKLRLFGLPKTKENIEELCGQDAKDVLNTVPEFVFCHKCGAKLSADSEYCNMCGTKLNY